MNRKKINPKLSVYQQLAKEGAWSNYPVCTFRHYNLYNNKKYIFEGHLIVEVKTGNFSKFKILTYDGKYWHKHKLLDEIKIIKPGVLDTDG